MTELKDIKLGRFTAGDGHSPFIIAEMSGNHNQSKDRAMELVKIAASAGAHALKLQTYTADTITLDSKKDDFKITDKGSLWSGKYLHDLYKEAYTPWEWHEDIFNACRELGMECFSSPFDETAVDFLEKLGCPFYKIASFENTDLRLIKKVASTGKPIIMSTGTTYMDELAESVRLIQSMGNPLMVLKCTSNYPADPKDSHLRTIPHMRELFNCHVGLSDHTLGIGVPLASVAMGAVAIEKHFTNRRADGGVDSAFSLEPDELKNLVEETERAARSLGRVSYNPTEKEIKSRQFKRSIYFVSDLKKGEIISEKDIRSVRPGNGLPIKYWDDVIGLAVTQNVEYGDALTWDKVKK